MRDGLPAKRSTRRREVMTQSLLVAWALAVIAWYAASLLPWMNPRIMKWGLPFFAMPALPVMSHFVFRVAALAFFLAVPAAAGVGPGLALARFLRQPTRSLGIVIPIGWAGMSAVLLGAAVTGCWVRAVLLALLAASGAAGIPHLLARLRSTDRTGGLVDWRRPEALLPAVLMGWILLLTCLAPESFQDAMRYHLWYPRRFLLEHKLFFVDHYFFWSYLGLPHMLYGLNMALGGDTAARAVNVAMALFSLAALLRIARAAGFDPPSRALLLGLTVTAPGLQLITGSAFIEHSWALYVLLAVERLLAARAAIPARARDGALLLGLAFTSKYTALFGAAGLLMMVTLGASRGAWRSALRRHGGTCAALLLAPNLGWAALRWLSTGDPLSPHLARLGIATLDASSSHALAAYYDFAAIAHRSLLSMPRLLLRYPVEFAGSHGGFWEHPGPAIPAMLLAMLVYAGRLPEGVNQLLLFAIGSVGGWFLFCGGVSPHYIMSIAGLWTAGAIGVLPALPGWPRRVLWNALTFCVFLQAILSFVAATFRFGPRDVAMGMVTTDYYLANGLEPKRVHYPIRRELERIAPNRGTVYVYGDDTSYYLSGRVFCDYENGSDPLLWRLAAESATPAALRIKLRQRDWTHMIYSTRWPDELGLTHHLFFRHSPATLDRMQAFWRQYARPVLSIEVPDAEATGSAYVYAFLVHPAAGLDASISIRRRPFLPGAEALVFDGDRAVDCGDLAGAEVAYTKQLRKFPRAGLLFDRMARLAHARHQPGSAADWARKARSTGWFSPAGSTPGR